MTPVTCNGMVAIYGRSNTMQSSTVMFTCELNNGFLEKDFEKTSFDFFLYSYDVNPDGRLVLVLAGHHTIDQARRGRHCAWNLISI